MSESISSSDGHVPEPGSVAGPAVDRPATTSAGALLRAGRLAAGLHIAALAVSLKVPVRRLEALEADRLDLLPDAVFVRALAGSVCRALKMDAAPVLALMPMSIPPRLNSVAEQTTDVFMPRDNFRGRPAWRSLSRPVVGGAAALVIAALGLITWPGISSGPGSDSSASADDSTASSSSSSVNPPVVELVTPNPASPALAAAPVLAAAVLPTATAASTLVPGGAPATPLAVPAAAALPKQVPATTPAAASASVAVAAPAAATGGIVVFRPSAASWIEVTDAKSTVVLRRMVAAGEVAGASGALPLSVVVGRADVTKVQVRGQAFDLSSIARENVARFEVK